MRSFSLYWWREGLPPNTCSQKGRTHQPSTGVHITPDVKTRLSWAVGLYSDLHKDVYGVRPRHFLPEPLPSGSELEELVTEVEDEIEWLRSLRSDAVA